MNEIDRSHARAAHDDHTPATAAPAALARTAGGFELPLSWSWTGEDRPESFVSVEAPGGRTFVHAADLQSATTESALLLRLRQVGRPFLKSASLSFAAAVRSMGGATLVLSHSARIDLEGYTPPQKPRNLARKGEKAVGVAEVTPVEICDEGEALIASLRDPGAPEILYTYRTSVRAALRVFAARTLDGGRLVGLVTLTQYGAGRWHVEQLARHREAPPGTMELLLIRIIAALQAEGATALNLGEVPLVFPRVDGVVVGWESMTRFNRLLARLAPFFARLVRRRYDVRGLYQFKNKWDPVWEARALCGFPRMGLMDALALMRACGILRLFG